MGAIKPGGGGASGTVADGSVTTAKLAANAVTLAKVDTTTVTAAALGATSYSSGLDGARPAASSGIVGAIYYATDTGYAYQCVSSTRWVRLGAGGVEGRDTTAVSASSSYSGTGTATFTSANIPSFALAFTTSLNASGATLLSIEQSTYGWHLEIGQNSDNRYELNMYRAGYSPSRMACGSVSASPTTPHIIAITLSGNTTRYSLDGGAVQTASHGTGSASSGDGPVRLANGVVAGATYQPISTVLWSTSVGDSDLVAVSGGYAGGRIAAVSGATEAWRWAAGWYAVGATKHPVLVGADTLTWSAATTLTVR